MNKEKILILLLNDLFYFYWLVSIIRASKPPIWNIFGTLSVSNHVFSNFIPDDKHQTKRHTTNPEMREYQIPGSKRIIQRKDVGKADNKDEFSCNSKEHK